MRSSGARWWLPAKLALIGLLSCSSCSTPNRAGDVAARLVKARGSGESFPAAIITLAFRNNSGDALQVQSYRVRWPGGEFTAEIDDLHLAPRAEIERTTRVDPHNGNIDALISRPPDVKVEVVRARPR